MSVGMAVLVIVMIVAAAIVGRITAANARKRFGLTEAEAAAQYISDPQSARTVKAVVIGALGYEDTVEAELEGLRTAIGSANDKLNQKAGRVGSKVQRLQARIADLGRMVSENSAQVRHAERVADTFSN